jgi:hypothetical protein
MGIRLPANSKVVMQIHYPGGISNQVDSTKLYLKLTTVPQREIEIQEKLNHYFLDNGPLNIPANTVKTFRAHYNVPNDMSILGVGPHMHLIGTSIYSYAVTPSNDTIPFINIPNWDFHWQGLYSLPKILKIPAGTTMYSSATYDNTTANPNNPSNPPHSVHLGESTTDEMMLIYFAYTDYQSGDENVIIDSAQFTAVQELNSTIVTTPQLYDIIPNPVNEKIVFQYYLPNAVKAKLSIIDISGKIVKEQTEDLHSGMITSQMYVSELSSGVYFLNLNANGIVRSKKFLKN